MYIQVDQSGRIEYTSRDTVIAFSNKTRKSVLIKAKDKREIQRIFRERGRGRIFIYRTFASLIYTLIQDELDEITQIVIDQEYEGHESEIKNYLLQIIRKANKDFPKENITFKRIGRKSKAHTLAHKVYQKKAEPDIVVKAEDIIVHLLRLK